MIWKTQYTSDCKTLEQAQSELDFLKTQVDYEGGRILDHTKEIENCYTVQVIFPDYGVTGLDGCIRVLCPASLLSNLQ